MNDTVFSYSAMLVVAALSLLLAPSHVNSANLLDVHAEANDRDAVIGAARASFEATKESIPLSRSQLLPSIGVSINTTWNETTFPDSVRSDGTGRELPEVSYNSHGWTSQITAPLVNLAGWHNVGQAKASVEAARHFKNSTEEQLLLRVVGAYLNVLRAEDRTDSAKAEETAVKRQLEQVQQRFEVGLVAITDVLEAQAAYDAAVVQRVQAVGDREIFFETLGTLTGRSYELLDGLTDELPIVPPSPNDESIWVSRALDHNQSVLAAKEQLRAASKGVSAARAGHLPTVNASISRNYNTSGAPNFFNSPKTDGTVYALQLNVPIFSGGATSAQTRQSRAQERQAREMLLDQQRITTRDTRNLYQAVITGVVRVQARQKAIASAESALEATQTGYEVGTRNIVDVLQAQQRLYSSQFQYADSRYTYILDLMALKQLSGQLTVDDLAELNGYLDSSIAVKRENSMKALQKGATSLR